MISKDRTGDGEGQNSPIHQLTTSKEHPTRKLLAQYGKAEKGCFLQEI